MSLKVENGSSWHETRGFLEAGGVGVYETSVNQSLPKHWIFDQTQHGLLLTKEMSRGRMRLQVEFVGERDMKGVAAYVRLYSDDPKEDEVLERHSALDKSEERIGMVKSVGLGYSSLSIIGSKELQTDDPYLYEKRIEINLETGGLTIRQELRMSP